MDDKKKLVKVNYAADYLSGLSLGEMAMKICIEALANLTENPRIQARHMIGVVDYISLAGAMLEIIVMEKNPLKTAKVSNETVRLILTIANKDKDWIKHVEKAQSLRRDLEYMKRNNLKRDEIIYDLYEKRYSDALRYVLDLLTKVTIETVVT